MQLLAGPPTKSIFDELRYKTDYDTIIKKVDKWNVM